MTLSIRFERGVKNCAKAQGVCVSLLRNRIADGLIPTLVELGLRARGLPLHELDAVNALRLAGLADDRMRTVVAQIIDSRAHGNRAPAVVQSIVDAALARAAAKEMLTKRRDAKEVRKRREARK